MGVKRMKTRILNKFQILTAILVVVLIMSLLTPLALAATEVAEPEQPIRPPVGPLESEEPVLEVISPIELGDVQAASWQTYTEAELPERKVINSVVDNPEWGDERHFLQITDLATGMASRDSMILAAGGAYEVTIYLRNGYKPSELSALCSFKTALQAPLPIRVKAGEAANFTATVTTEDAVPGVVSTNLRLLSREDLTLKYVDGSAICRTNAATSSKPLDYETLLMGSYKFRVAAGIDNARWITYTIAAVATPADGTYLDDAEWGRVSHNFEAQSNGAVAHKEAQGSSSVFWLTFMLIGESVLVLILSSRLWRLRRRAKPSEHGDDIVAQRESECSAGCCYIGPPEDSDTRK